MAYAFPAAIIAWHDPDLERLYLFGKFLLPRHGPALGRHGHRQGRADPRARDPNGCGGRVAGRRHR
jgi:hypothetical protein